MCLPCLTLSLSFLPDTTPQRDEMRKLEEIQADLERKNEELGPANSDVQGQDTITTVRFALERDSCFWVNAVE